MRRDATLRFLGIGTCVAVLLGAATSVRALPPPEAPQSPPKESPSPLPTGAATLPFGSPLLFVLDQGVNSGTTTDGTVVRMHLKAPLVVNGVTLAAAGTPATFTIVETRKAQSGDVDGAVAVHLDPLTLPGRNQTLPIRAYHEYLTRELTGGQQATRSTVDTTADVFVPYYVLYQALRKGHQMVLPPGTVLRAETEATIDARDPNKIVLATPAPFASNYDAPHSELTPAPFYTPAPVGAKPLPKGKPTLPPTPAATAIATAPASGAVTTTPAARASAGSSPATSPT